MPETLADLIASIGVTPTPQQNFYQRPRLPQDALMRPGDLPPQQPSQVMGYLIDRNLSRAAQAEQQRQAQIRQRNGIDPTGNAPRSLPQIGGDLANMVFEGTGLPAAKRAIQHTYNSMQMGVGDQSMAEAQAGTNEALMAALNVGLLAGPHVLPELPRARVTPSAAPLGELPPGFARLYHGTPSDVAAADIQPSPNGLSGPGIYNYTNPESASGYGPNVHTFNVPDRFVDIREFDARNAINHNGAKTAQELAREGYVGVRHGDVRTLWANPLANGAGVRGSLSAGDAAGALGPDGAPSAPQGLQPPSEPVTPLPQNPGRDIGANGLPIAPRAPFRTSLQGGSNDLMDAARSGQSAPDAGGAGVRQFEITKSPDGFPAYNFTSGADRYQVILEPHGDSVAVGFNRLDADGYPRSTWRETGGHSPFQAAAVYRNVLDAVRRDAQTRGAAEYRFSGVTPKQRELYSSEAGRRALTPPPGYRLEMGPSLQNGDAPVWVRESRTPASPDGGAWSSEPLWHGTRADFERFDTNASPINSRGEDRAVWLTSDQDHAHWFSRLHPIEGGAARTIPAQVRGRLLEYDAKEELYDRVPVNDIMRRARAEGYAGVRFRNMVDDAETNPDAPIPDQVAVFDASNVRRTPTAPARDARGKPPASSVALPVGIGAAEILRRYGIHNDNKGQSLHPDSQSILQRYGLH